MGTALALGSQVAMVSADLGGPPEGSGRTLTTNTGYVCGASSCTSVSLTAHEIGAVREICIDTSVTDLNGQLLNEAESGCSTDVGAWQTSAGFITGLGGTTVPMSNELGETRNVSISISTALAGAIVPSTEVIDGSDATCAIRWTVKERTVPVAGTVTFDGMAYATATEAISVIRSLKEKVRCA